MADAPLDVADPARLQSLLHGMALGHAAGLGMASRAAAEAAELAAAALAHPGFRELLGDATAARREVPFAVPLAEVGLGEGSGRGMAEGSIDLLLSGEQGSVVVDYKTDRVEPGAEAAHAEGYWPQVALYAVAVHAARGGTLPEMVVFFVRTGALLRREMDADLAARVADMAAQQVA
jgi:ATP-dependent exoDNAse (exonuclease V) beta subunit